MLLTENSIQLVRDASITEVVSHFVQLDRNGKALCPFHNEKSPSFKVTESKDIYKCFGCGRSGDAIEFVMQHEKVDFIKSIELIAGIIGVHLQYEEVPDKEKYEEQKAFKDQLKETVSYAIQQYKQNLIALPEDHPVNRYLELRKKNLDIILDWQLGWATEEWRHLTPQLINQERFQPGEKLGLIKRSKSGENNFDGYRSRITIPITNHHGEFIGLAGRYFQIDPADTGKDYPKYLNPPENEIYSKSSVLFGLSKAIKAIQKQGCCYLVEGYFDVISMHANGDENTVASCGTALTLKQAQLLKKYTSHVVLLRDGDNAGFMAAQKDLPILLQAGFKVDIIILPAGEDPDSFTLKLDSYNSSGVSFKELKIGDAFLWQVALWVKEAAGDDYKLGSTKQNVVRLCSKINNELIRGNYFDSVCKHYKWNRTEMLKQLNVVLDENKEEEVGPEETNLSKLPKWMDKEEFLNNGYCQVNNKSRTGYYTFGGGGQVEITNFIIIPLFHIYAGKESRHLIQIDNGRNKAVLDIESKALVSIDLLQQYVVSEGAFIIYGQKLQMLRIANTLLRNFPKCLEIKFLGWQPDGFFAFVDIVYVPGQGLKPLDEWGMAKHKENNYLIPAASAAYKELQKTGDDPYESDRVLKYIKSDIDFSGWAKLMKRVYFDKGVVAIAYTILTIFRDIVFSVDNNCPHLYAFGEKSSGKSKWAESIAAVFYNGRSAFNLNSGTDYAFFIFMQRFKNCPALLNEFDEKVIRLEWFQVLKGAFDGEGRQKGVMGSKNRTEIMKINSTIVLMGQFLVTMDDNSIVSRSIIEGFNEREVTEEDKEKYNQLKDLEESGLSSLVCEILQYRDEFKGRYKERFNEVLSDWRQNTGNDGQAFNQRIMQNWCHLYTSYDVISKYITLPESNEKFENYCKKSALQWSAFIRSSDTLSEFWSTFSFLVDQGAILEGWDFRIETKLEVRIRKDREEEYTVSFPEPTKLLFLRMGNVHKMYQEAYRKRTGKEGMSEENLNHYMTSRKYYVGPNKNSIFKKWVVKTENVPRYTGQTSVPHPEIVRQQEQIKTSSIVFLYSQLNLDIERSNVEMDGPVDKPVPVQNNGYVPVSQEIPF